jgi:1-aminocyclopropane-1-carboxylate deaminase
MQANSVSPVFLLNSTSSFKQCTYPVWLKYDALNDRCIQGNKYWKLYGLSSFISEKGFSGVCTFGGAHSNHLAAIACWGERNNIPVLAIVRGEMDGNESHTLTLARQKGVQIKFVTRSDYRIYTQGEKQLSAELLPKGFYLVPEGGTTPLLFQGVRIFVEEVMEQFNAAGQNVPYDWFLPGGTGGSTAGLLSALNNNFNVHCVNVLKNLGLEHQITQFMKDSDNPQVSNPFYYNQYHLGGYARYSAALVDFIQQFFDETGIYLDPVYTGKLLYTVSHWVKTTNQQPSQGLLIWHTGGLQGIRGYNQRWGTQLPESPATGINLPSDLLGILQ